jgi:hypothetical protein
MIKAHHKDKNKEETELEKKKIYIYIYIENRGENEESCIYIQLFSGMLTQQFRPYNFIFDFFNFRSLHI